MEVKNVTQKFDLGDIYCLFWQLGHSFFPFRLSAITSFQRHLKLQFWQRGIKYVLSSAGFWLIGKLDGIGQCDNK
ncbi:hypothetical protein BBI15_07240 [Planococcus plakortidis]|uniref:Uncharacterized protein n=1 Tax=Planococcus plakortidis TaxID=1038856 RepID=A0A1C7E837_9BACL|nr:hypothetical protein [Planococcus plakortidis]ANU20020.1 hypothetical protein BBI15_07240 [Planococcus plakortidis]